MGGTDYSESAVSLDVRDGILQVVTFLLACLRRVCADVGSVGHGMGISGWACGIRVNGFWFGLGVEW